MEKRFKVVVKEHISGGMITVTNAVPHQERA